MNSRDREKTKRRRVSAAEWADKQDAGWDPTSVKLPEKAERFQVKQTGKFKLDHVPYVAGKLNPDADEGFEINSLRFFVHWVPTLDGKNKSYCCAAQVFNKPCAACDYLKENRDADEELKKSLKAKTRMLWNVIDLSDKGKIKIWETAYWRSYGELLKDAIKDTPEFSNFDDPEKGLTVRVTVKDSTSRFGKFEIARVDLVPREEQYKQSIIDKAYCLDDMLVEPDYDEVKSMLEGKPTEADEEDDEEEPEEPSDIEEEDDDEEEDRSNHKADKKKKKEPVAEEDEDEEEDEPEEDSDDEEDEEEESDSDEDDADWGDDEEDEEEDSSDDDEDEEDEEDEEPAPKKNKTAKPPAKKKTKR